MAFPRHRSFVVFRRFRFSFAGESHLLARPFRTPTKGNSNGPGMNSLPSLSRCVDVEIAFLPRNAGGRRAVSTPSASTQPLLARLLTDREQLHACSSAEPVEESHSALPPTPDSRLLRHPFTSTRSNSFKQPSIRQIISSATLNDLPRSSPRPSSLSLHLITRLSLLLLSPPMYTLSSLRTAVGGFNKSALTPLLSGEVKHMTTVLCCISLWTGASGFLAYARRWGLVTERVCHRMSVILYSAFWMGCLLLMLHPGKPIFFLFLPRVN
jgi:hypothetical protein